MNSPLEKDLRATLKNQADQDTDHTEIGSVVGAVDKRYRRVRAQKMAGIGLAAITAVGVGAAVLPSVLGGNNGNVVLSASPTGTQNSSPSGATQPGGSGASPSGAKAGGTPNVGQGRSGLLGNVLVMTPEGDATLEYAKQLAFADCMRKKGFEIEDPEKVVLPRNYDDYQFVFGVGIESTAQLNETMQRFKHPQHSATYYAARDGVSKSRWDAAALGAEESADGSSGSVPLFGGCTGTAKVAAAGGKSAYDSHRSATIKLVRKIHATRQGVLKSTKGTAINEDLSQCIKSRGWEVYTPDMGGLVQAHTGKMPGRRDAGTPEDPEAWRKAVEVDLACYTATDALTRYYSELASAEGKLKANKDVKKLTNDVLTSRQQRLAAAQKLIAKLAKDK